LASEPFVARAARLLAVAEQAIRDHLAADAALLTLTRFSRNYLGEASSNSAEGSGSIHDMTLYEKRGSTITSLSASVFAGR